MANLLLPISKSSEHVRTELNTQLQLIIHLQLII